MDRERPRGVAIAAALIALMGVVAVYLGLISFGLPGAVGRNDSPWLVAGGVAALIASAMVWRAVPGARWTGMAVALFALLPGIYGVGGLAVVVQNYLNCQDGSMASLTFTSYPEGYCGIVSWPYQFGVGIGLIAIGVAGILTIFALIWNSDYFRRGGAQGHRA